MTSTYDETIWDGADNDAEPSPLGGDNVADAPEEITFKITKIPFCVSIKNGDLDGKTSLEFSVKNKALNPAHFEHVGLDEFNGKDNLFSYNLVNKVSVQNFQVAGLKEPLEISFGEIRTVPRKSFSGLPTAAASNESKSAPVRFTVTPGKENAGSFDANLSADVIQHAAVYPEISKDKVTKSYGSFRSVNWASLDSPIIDVLTPEQQKKLRENSTYGIYEYSGDFSDLEAAGEKFLDMHETNVVYSDLSPNKFSFTLNVPAVNRYDAKTDSYITNQPSFYELVASPAILAHMKSPEVMANKQAKAAIAHYNNQYRKFSGVIVIESNVPKTQ